MAEALRKTFESTASGIIVFPRSTTATSTGGQPTTALGPTGDENGRRLGDVLWTAEGTTHPRVDDEGLL